MPYEWLPLPVMQNTPLELGMWCCFRHHRYPACLGAMLASCSDTGCSCLCRARSYRRLGLAPGGGVGSTAMLLGWHLAVVCRGAHRGQHSNAAAMKLH
jgi:hypothetical protein